MIAETIQQGVIRIQLPEPQAMCVTLLMPGCGNTNKAFDTAMAHVRQHSGVDHVIAFVGYNAGHSIVWESTDPGVLKKGWPLGVV